MDQGKSTEDQDELIASPPTRVSVLEMENKTPQKHVPLNVLLVRSDGLVNGTVKLTVAYHALPDHTVDWRYMHEFGPYSIRSAGQLEQKTMDGDIMYECSNSIYGPFRTRTPKFVVLHSGTESIHITFNTTTLESVWIYTIPQWENTFMNATSRVIAPQSGNLTIPIFLKAIHASSISKDRVHVFYSGLNTSTEPSSIFETAASHDRMIDMVLIARSSPEPFQMNVTLMHEIVKYGGILTIRLPEEVDTKYIENFNHGVAIDILRANTKEVIPRGAVGVYDSPWDWYFFGNATSVLCSAMGNTSPDVKIFKQLSGNRYEEQTSETVFKDRWTRVDVVTLLDKWTQSGNYTCRARSGTMTASVDIEVLAAEKATFVHNETGIVESSADRTVVQCMATGIPTPDLTFELFYEYGPDMIESGRYKYERHVHNNTASLRMTISPVDVGIHQVYCRGKQPDYMMWITELIVLFPNESRWNYTLYNQLTHEQW